MNRTDIIKNSEILKGNLNTPHNYLFDIDLIINNECNENTGSNDFLLLN